VKTSHWHSCNVLDLRAETRRLWQFGAGNGEVSFHAEQRLAPAAPLPAKLVAKDWGTLWRKRLNIAWLPTDQVFLRVVHLPRCEPDELRSMVELKLEKISPLPVNQIVWSFETVPQSAGELQTIVILIAERKAVESFLGRLENAGYLADRLELPLLHQSQGTRIEGEGAWIYLHPTDTAMVCLVAWWIEGTLQQVNLLHLPKGEQGAAWLGDQLNKLAWAGEVEGWLAAPTRWHLVADQAAGAEWEPALRPWTNEPIELGDALESRTLAELTAQRAARLESQANLLPEDFVDRLWMGGLAAATLVYLAGVLIYFSALQVLKYQTNQVQRQVAALKGAYSDALQLKAKLKLLQEQVSLRYAALDCWKIASELLPTELTLKAFTFSRGDLLELRGSAPADADGTSKVTEYNTAMRKATLHGAAMFQSVQPAVIQVSGDSAGWGFNCELQPNEIQ
jgi:hypothetical protein